MAVAVDSDINHSYEIKDLRHSLRSANLELSLARSKHSVEAVAKDENIRKLRVGQCLLESDNSDLHTQLEEEQARSDDLENALDDALLDLDEQKAESQVAQNQVRTQLREIANLKAELRAMENITFDSNKILSEKLALSREISSLRPEVEHLRAQTESNQGLLSEKLALQRQLTTSQIELENEKRASARTISKQGKKMELDEELRTELEEARKELASEKKDRIRAEAAVAKAEKAVEKVQADLESQQKANEKLDGKLEKLEKLAKKDTKASKRDEAADAALEELRQELEREKALRVKAEKSLKKAANDNDEIEQLREQLELERKARQKAEKAAKKGSEQTDEASDAQKELEEEKRERKKQEKAYTKTLAELEGRNTVLDDKLSAFREKLRTTKEKLKEKEAQLERVERAQTAPPAKTAADVSKAAKNIRKRTAASVEPETQLGTPGDAPAKRFKRGTSVSAMGDTSTFSLSPFLNRTTVTAGSPIAEEDEQDSTAPIAAPKLQPAKPLASTAGVKANPKPRKKTALSSVLAAVDEEEDDIPSKDAPAPSKVPLNDVDDGAAPGLKAKKSSKPAPRKSLLTFANFTSEAPAEKKKKRKLGASNRTLFDAEEEDGESSQPKAVGLGSGKGLFAARALGKAALGKGRPISGGFGMLSEEAFTFSPLKKDKRRMGDSILK